MFSKGLSQSIIILSDMANYDVTDLWMSHVFQCLGSIVQFSSISSTT